jgi:hypothetical protein
MNDLDAPLLVHQDHSCFVYGGRLRKGRFLQTADAVGVGFLRWLTQKGVFDVGWIRVGRSQVMAKPWKLEEETSAECLRCKHSVGWRSPRIILALQDQRRKAR